MVGSPKIGAVLLIGGEGQRFGSPTPKQFHLLNGKPLFQYALDTLLEADLFDEIVLVCHPRWIQEIRKGQIVEGGATRQQSSLLGLQGFKTKPDIVLIHDGVRPFVTKKILQENITAAKRWGAANTCISSADTLVYAPGCKQIIGIPERKDFLRGQTPQTFRMDWILEAHAKATSHNATDDCQLVLKIGKPVSIVMGSERNIKITTEFDLLLAEKILSTECKAALHSVDA